MNKITYIIGAGFSAPLGLPLMSNFLIKSKDMFAEEPEKYKHFNYVFNKIKQMAICNSYFNTDLFNIEEILSIIEMNNYVSKQKSKAVFNKYIIDVIKKYTPEFDFWEINKRKIHDLLICRSDIHNLYLEFICNILGVCFRKGEMNPDTYIEPIEHKETFYSIISFNYDLVFENMLVNLKNNFKFSKDFGFEKNEYLINWDKPHLSKLHGCIESETIIPPTWTKGQNKNIIKIWKNAFDIISNSNELRIIGYSLPATDSYIKYFLKSAIVNTENLRNIDVIVLDKSGEVKNRYNDFINFPNYRYFNTNIIDYLKYFKNEKRTYIEHKGGWAGNTIDCKMNTLEKMHLNFVRSN